MEKEQIMNLASLANKQLKLLNKKKCSKCNNILNILEFADKQARCKSCRSETVLEKYHANNQLINNQVFNVTNNYIKIDTFNDNSSVNVKTVNNTQIFNQAQLELNKDKLIQPINTPVKTSIYQKYISDVEAVNLKRGRQIIELSKKNKPIHFDEQVFLYKCNVGDLRIIFVKIKEYLPMIKYPKSSNEKKKSAYEMITEKVNRPPCTAANFEDRLKDDTNNFPFISNVKDDDESLNKIIDGLNRTTFEDMLTDPFYTDNLSLYNEITEFLKYIEIHNFKRNEYFKLGIGALSRWTNYFKNNYCNIETVPVY